MNIQPSDGLRGQTVADVMVRAPKTLSDRCTVREARDSFRDDHVHILLLTDSTGSLRGTLLRADLEMVHGAANESPAIGFGEMSGRTVEPHCDAESARRRLLDTGERRRAVLDTHGRLVGLLC